MKETVVRIMESDPSHAQIQFTEDDGSVCKKTVDTYSLLRTFESAENGFMTKCSPVNLIPEWLSFIQFYPCKSIHYSAGVVVPAGRHRFSYIDHPMIVPYPALLFVFEVEDNRLKHGKCFALDSNKFTKESKLYVYPFGNVSPNGGNICFGSNRLPEISEFADLEKVIGLFLGSETNNDYYEITAMSAKPAHKYHTQLTFLEHLETLKSFPKKYLKESTATI